MSSSWRDELHAQAKPTCNHSARVAFCFAGSARTFATPLLLEYHYANFVQRLVVPPGPAGLSSDHASSSRLFLYLKTADSNKTHEDRPLDQQFLAQHTPLQPLFEALRSGSWVRRMLGEAVVLGGGGSYDGRGWTPDDDRAAPEAAYRESNEHLAAALRPNASKCRDHAFNKTRSATDVALGLSWCAHAIGRYEQRHGVRFDLIAYARPDQLFFVPLPTPCRFPFHRTVFACQAGGSDGLWVASRQNASQILSVLDEHSKCTDESPVYQCMTNRQKHLRVDPGLHSVCKHKALQQPACCGPGEMMLAHSLAAPSALPVEPLLCEREFEPYRFNFIRQGLFDTGPLAGNHTCEIAMSANYDFIMSDASAAHDKGGSARARANYRRAMVTRARLSPIQARALRQIFGAGDHPTPSRRAHATRECVAALTPIDRPYDIITR